MKSHFVIVSPPCLSLCLSIFLSLFLSINWGLLRRPSQRISRRANECFHVCLSLSVSLFISLSVYRLGTFMPSQSTSFAARECEFLHGYDESSSTMGKVLSWGNLQ